MEDIKLRNFKSLSWLSYVPNLTIYTVSQKILIGGMQGSDLLTWLLVFCWLVDEILNFHFFAILFR